jgi:hypothetical protein
MAQERSSGGSCVILILLLLSCKYGFQMKESFTKSRHDCLLFIFLFVFISPVECYSLEKFAVLGAQSLQTSNLLKGNKGNPGMM